MFPLFIFSISMWVVQQPSPLYTSSKSSCFLQCSPSILHDIFHNLIFSSWSQFFSWALFFQFNFQAFVGILFWFVSFIPKTFPYYFILLFITLLSKVLIFKCQSFCFLFSHLVFLLYILKNLISAVRMRMWEWGDHSVGEALSGQNNSRDPIPGTFNLSWLKRIHSSSDI